MSTKTYASGRIHIIQLNRSITKQTINLIIHLGHELGHIVLLLGYRVRLRDFRPWLQITRKANRRLWNKHGDLFRSAYPTMSLRKAELRCNLLGVWGLAFTLGFERATATVGSRSS